MGTSGSDSPVPERVNTSAIENALALEDYETVISEVRVAIAANPGAALADPVINDWLGKRFRNIFIDFSYSKYHQSWFYFRNSNDL